MLISVQFQLQKQYSVELKNPGVSSVKVRRDSKIMASGGWDGRSVQIGHHLEILSMM